MPIHRFEPGPIRSLHRLTTNWATKQKQWIQCFSSVDSGSTRDLMGPGPNPRTFVKKPNPKNLIKILMWFWCTSDCRSSQFYLEKINIYDRNIGRGNSPVKLAFDCPFFSRGCEDCSAWKVFKYTFCVSFTGFEYQSEMNKKNDYGSMTTKQRHQIWAQSGSDWHQIGQIRNF